MIEFIGSFNVNVLYHSSFKFKIGLDNDILQSHRKSNTMISMRSNAVTYN